MCRSTALGANRVCRQLRRRRLAFAPGAGAPTVGSGFSDMFCVGAPPSVRTGLPATPPPAGIRTRGGCSYSGLGLLRYILRRSTAPVRTGLPATPPPPAGIRTRGGCSYGGFGLLRYVSCRSTAPGAKRVCRQPRRRLAFAPGAGAPTVGSGFSDMFRVGAPPSVRNGFATTPPPADIRTRGGCSYSGLGLLRYVLCRSTALGAKRVCRQLRRRRQAFAPGAGAPTVG